MPRPGRCLLRRVRLAVVSLPLALLTAGCGGSGSAGGLPAIQAARTYELATFRPAAAATARKPTPLSFTIRTPSGGPLTRFRRGPGPHTGVHLIVVRSDLGVLIHHHPPVGANGRIDDVVRFPTPGRYRVVVDAYPNVSGPQRNFQLFRWVDVGGAIAPHALPPPQRSVVTDGFRVTIRGRPRLHAIQAAFLHVDVRDAQGRPARFTPLFGAIAHAIFFRAGSLDYFHTHVCAPGAAGCASTLGGTTVAGRSTAPGRLDVGVLLPRAGTWRLFLQCRADGRILTAPFTLRVAA